MAFDVATLSVVSKTWQIVALTMSQLSNITHVQARLYQTFQDALINIFMYMAMYVYIFIIIVIFIFIFIFVYIHVLVYL